MALNFLKPKQALNKAFLKVKLNRTEIEKFKSNLIRLIDRTDKANPKSFTRMKNWIPNEIVESPLYCLYLMKYIHSQNNNNQRGQEGNPSEPINFFQVCLRITFFCLLGS
jgi:hypothetical protein